MRSKDGGLGGGGVVGGGGFSERSSAASAIAKRSKTPLGPYCKQAVGSTDHVLWHCPAIPGVRPHPKPRDPLQARLAWPSGRRDDEEIYVMIFVLQQKYDA